MRVSTLSAACAAALVLPAAAAPLAETTTVVVPLLDLTLTLVATGFSEVPNLPLATAPALPTGGMTQSHRLTKSKSKLARLPRADFREADYGVNRNVTFTRVPVVGVESVPSNAPPSPTATAAVLRRSEEDWEADRLDPDDAYYAAADPTSSGDDLSEAAAAADTGSGSGSSVPATPHAPLAVGDLKNANANSVPVHPDLSSASLLAGKGMKTTGESRYAAAYATHDSLGALFKSTSSSAQPNALAKSPATGLGGGLLRRVLQPAQYLATPVRRAFDLLKGLDKSTGKGKGKGMGAHTLQLDTDPLVPSRPDPNLNMSDTYVAQEEMRRKHAGVVNLDSNRPAPPPPPPLTAGDLPLNGTATNATTAATGEGLPNDGLNAEDEKKATALPVDEDAAKKPATVDHDELEKSSVDEAKKGAAGKATSR
ncbi:hypothetical protein BV20DRAFT_592275 [Pilatotrama ljubarskyi]|nr:hypothetical protein BV20DRAFT_592275 [Pilatotrama ljubarskyi]